MYDFRLIEHIIFKTTVHSFGRTLIWKPYCLSRLNSIVIRPIIACNPLAEFLDSLISNRSCTKPGSGDKSVKETFTQTKKLLLQSGLNCSIVIRQFIHREIRHSRSLMAKHMWTWALYLLPDLWSLVLPELPLRLFSPSWGMNQRGVTPIAIRSAGHTSTSGEAVEPEKWWHHIHHGWGWSGLLALQQWTIAQAFHKTC